MAGRTRRGAQSYGTRNGRRATLRAVGILAAALLATDCGPFLPQPIASTDSFGDHIDVSNGTTLAIAIVVNGSVVGIAPAGGASTIRASQLPPKPWAVEARTASGRILISFEVAPGDVTRTVDANGTTTGSSGVGGRVDLSCGRLDVSVGAAMLGPPPGPGQPGDCVP